jgi:hypothetical protein
MPATRKVLGFAQKMEVGPRIPVGIQLETPEVGPTPGPTKLATASPAARAARPVRSARRSPPRSGPSAAGRGFTLAPPVCFLYTITKEYDYYTGWCTDPTDDVRARG